MFNVRLNKTQTNFKPITHRENRGEINDTIHKGMNAPFNTEIYMERRKAYKEKIAHLIYNE